MDNKVYDKFQETTINETEVSDIYLNANFDGYLVKGDISGIQKFIFNVSSTKAAQSLRCRSYYIQMVCYCALERILNELNEAIKTSKRILYNGGGNFYLFLSKEENKSIKLNNIFEDIIKELQYDQIYLSFALIKINRSSFGETISQLKLLTNKNKLKKFQNLFTLIENPISENDNPKIKWGPIFNAISKKIKNEETTKTKETLTLFGINISDVINNNDFSLKALPRWDGELIKDTEINEIIEKRNALNKSLKNYIKVKNNAIIDFQYLAEFAKLRTGTAKLGVLKMDIDNLSDRIEKINSPKLSNLFSQYLNYFFNEYIFTIWDSKFECFEQHDENINQTSSKLKNFNKNIYPIFTGGDDCFFVGGWDTIIQFSIRINESFRKYNEYLRKQIPEIFEHYNKDLTLSAGITLIDSHFPVVRFSDLAEDALYRAKSKPGKNAVNIFKTTLSWEQLNKVLTYKNKLLHLIIKKGESRALLERIKHSASLFDKMQKTAIHSHFPFQEVWRFKYYLRNVKEKNQEFVKKEILSDYEKILINAYRNKEYTNSMMYPIAARLAELETRKKNKKNETGQ